MESMTNAPYLLPQARKGYRLGNSQIVDSMVNDGLWDIYNNYHMGMTGENVAREIRRHARTAGRIRRELAPEGGRRRWKECRFKSADCSGGAAGKEERRSASHVRER